MIAWYNVVMPYRKSLKGGGSSAYIALHNFGDGEQFIFRSDEDRHHFMVLLKRLRRQLPRLHLLGFCLTRDGFQLIVQEESRGDSAKLMQRLGIAYSIYFNAKYGKTGKVFQGPYKDRLLTKDDDIIIALCEMHRLPMKEHENIETYRWSSYRNYLAHSGLWIDKRFVETYFATKHYKAALRKMTISTAV